MSKHFESQLETIIHGITSYDFIDVSMTNIVGSFVSVVS